MEDGTRVPRVTLLNAVSVSIGTITATALGLVQVDPNPDHSETVL